MGTGATNVSGVRFDLKDRDAVEREAVTLAVRDARRRADAIAAGASVQIYRVLRIEELRDGDIGQPRPMAMTVMRSEVAQAAVPIEAGEIEVRARVTLTVAIR